MNSPGEKYFVTFIIGYFKALHSFSIFQNYYLYPAILAQMAGFKTVVIVKEGVDLLKEDPHFNGNVIVIEYKNIFQFIFLLVRFCFKNSVFYINNHNIRSYIALVITGFLGRINIFMGHIQPKRTTQLRQMIFNTVIYFTTYVRLNNQNEKKYLTEVHCVPEEKLIVIPIAIDMNNFFLKESNYLKRNGVVYYGNTTTQKGFPTMFEAISIVKKDIPNIEFHIVGSKGDYLPEEHIFEYGLEKNVFLHGPFKHGEELNDLLNTFEIFIISTKAEGQCLAVYESALSGNALCLPKIMSFEENFKDKALFHELGDSEVLAKNIITFLTDKNLIVSYNDKSRDYIKKEFSEERVRGDFLHFLTNIYKSI